MLSRDISINIVTVRLAKAASERGHEEKREQKIQEDALSQGQGGQHMGQ